VELPPDNNYKGIVGSCMFAYCGTRPDIGEAVGILARKMQAPTERDLTRAKRLLRYLKGTSDRGLVFSSKAANQGRVIVYADANYAGDKKTLKSTSGWVVMKNGAAINWSSKLQSILALSTTEAEIMAASSAAQEVAYLLRWHEDVETPITEPITIYNDNSGAVALAHNPVFHARTKHLGIKQLFVRELVKDKSVTVKHLSTKKMIADGLTKPMTRDQHYRLFNIMQGIGMC